MSLSVAGSVTSGSTIYVANLASHDITPIDASTGIAEHPIGLGALSPVALAVAPGAKTLYVVAVGGDEDGSPGSVVPIATATDRPGRPIAVGTAPQAIAITPNGKRAYVLNGIDAATTPATTPATVTPIDLATGTALRPIKVGTLPLSMTMSPNGKLLYVVDSSQSNPGEPSAITPVDTATDTSAPAIKLARDLVPFSVSGLAFMSNSVTAYAITSAGIVPINTAKESLGKAIGLRTSMPVAIAVTRDDTALAEVGVPVTHLEQGSPYANNNTLALLSTATGVVRKVATLGDEPGAMSWEVAIAPNGSTAYVLATTSSPRQSTVIPVDLATGTAGKTIDVGRNASTLTISPNGATVFVLDSGTYVGVGSSHNIPGRVIPIATSTGTAGKAITVGLAPAAFAITPTSQKR
jgi:DNA-binding beta-propeller fold protein YncE